MSFAGIGKLPEPYVIEQIVGQPDLSAAALELAKVAKRKELLHMAIAQKGDVPGDSSITLILVTETWGFLNFSRSSPDSCGITA